MEALTDLERKFALYTGARCPKQKRDDIIQLAGEGRKPDEIRRLVHVHRETVLNVLDMFAVEIADYAHRMEAKLRRCKWALADRIEREVDAIPRQALGITFKIVSEQEATDSGRAIARVDHVHRIDLFTDWPDFVRELEARPVMDEKNGAGDADQEPQAEAIHFEPGKNLLVESSAADPGLELQSTPAAADPGGKSDWKSEDLGLPTQVTQADTPTFTPDSGSKSGETAAAADREGRGSADAPAAKPYEG
jgi:hypothetical protein